MKGFGVETWTMRDGKSLRRGLIHVDNTGGLARLSLDRLTRHAERHDRCGICKIPLPI
jgi:hypothetical protein